MRSFFVLIALFYINLCVSQNNGIEIIEENTKEYYTFKGYNTMNNPVEITFELKELTGLEYDGVPRTLLIQPKETVEILSLKKSGGSIGFLMDYQQILIPAKLYKPEDFKKYETGIIVFTKDGCARCNYTSSYLIDKKVDFTLLNFSRDPAVEQYMWDKLKEQGVSGSQVNTPVIMVDGYLSHSHENLKRFVKDLAK